MTLLVLRYDANASEDLAPSIFRVKIEVLHGVTAQYISN